jgi:RsiW-degrading membrane proteinase PrsW (M82 family)
MMQTIAHNHVIVVKMVCTTELLQNYMTIFATVVIYVTALFAVLTYCILSFLKSCAKDVYYTPNCHLC